MITHIVNIMTIRQGIIPDDQNSTRVILFHTKCRRNDATVYITISILIYISKVTDNVIHDQCSTYLKSNGVMYEFQSGFRQSFSTNTCFYSYYGLHQIPK